MTADTTRSRFSVAEVIGQVSGKPLADHVAAACSAKGKVAKVERVELAHLPGLEETEKRREVLADNGMSFSCHGRGGCYSVLVALTKYYDRS